MKKIIFTLMLMMISVFTTAHTSYSDSTVNTDMNEKFDTSYLYDAVKEAYKEKIISLYNTFNQRVCSKIDPRVVIIENPFKRSYDYIVKKTGYEVDVIKALVGRKILNNIDDDVYQAMVKAENSLYYLNIEDASYNDINRFSKICSNLDDPLYILVVIMF